MSYFSRAVLLASFVAAGLTACNGDGPKFSDGGLPDGNQQDAQVVDTDPPDTTISVEPAALTNVALAHFEFTATESSNFECAVDGAAAAACTSPFEITVGEGEHTFSVVATDLAGNVDPTPATATWTVDLTPPDTTITTHPPALDNSVDVALEFTATEDGTFECQVDGGGFAACTTPDMLTALADGSHTFDVRAIDAAGNVDDTPATWTWTIDSSTPDTRIDSGPTGAVSQTGAVFEFSSPNAGANATYKCGLDTTTLTACTSPITYDSLADGDHTFTVQVTNQAGTSDPTPATQTWTVDTMAPTVTITKAPANPTNIKTPSTEFTTSGNPTTVECQVDGGAYAACTSPFVTGALADGAHTVTIRATDAAGNSGSASASFTVDTMAPSVVIDAPTPSNPTNKTSATFTFHSADGGTSFECAMDAGAYAACSSSKAYTGLTGGAGTSHTFHVRAKDAAGNTGTDTTFTWTIDTQAPSVAVGTPTPKDPTNTTTATFYFTSADTTATFECAMDAGAFGTCTTGKTYTGLLGGTGTSHTFHVRAKDPAGNTGAEDTFTWMIDTVAPTASITSGPIDPTPTKNPTPQFGFTTGGSPKTIECGVDGAFVACTSPYTTPSLGDGAHTMQVRVTDAANNSSTTPPRKFTVDTTAPTVTIGTPTPKDPTNATTATFYFTSADTTATFECAMDTGGFGSCTTGKTYTSLLGGTGTSHTFHVRATDLAGNTGPEDTFTWMIDTVAPTASITGGPIDPTPTNNPKPQFGFTTGGSPTKIECGVDGAFVPCTSPYTTSTLADGAHTIVVRVTDAANNSFTTPVRKFTVDTVAPTASITSGPIDPKPTNSRTPQFGFTTGGSPNKIECGVDGTFVTCASPYTTSTLADGAHTIVVRVTDAATNTYTTPVRKFTVDTKAPDTTIAVSSEPANPTPVTSVTFTFTSTEANSTFICQLDSGAPTSCDTGSASYSGLSSAQHTFSVYATDWAGNPDPSAATYTWVVNSNAPTINRVPPSGWTVSYFPFAFSGPVAGVAYECSTGGAYAACTSPFTATNAVYGATNTFRVRWVDAKGNRSAARTATWVPNQGLVLYYPFNGDSRNYSVLEYPKAYYNHDGSLAPATTWGGYAGGAAQFGGDNVFAKAAQPMTSGVAYAVSIWVYNPSGGAGGVPIWQNYLSGSAGCVMAVTSSTTSGDSSTLACVDQYAKQIGKVTGYLNRGWNNLTLQYYGTGHGDGNGGDVDFFVNGNLVGTLTNAPKLDLFPSTQVVKVTRNGSFFLDELRMYNTTYKQDALCNDVIRGIWDPQQSYCALSDLGIHYAFDTQGPVTNRGTWTAIGLLDLGQTPIAGVVGGAYVFSTQAGFGYDFVKGVPWYGDISVSAWFNDAGGKGRIFDTACTANDTSCQGRVGGVWAEVFSGKLQVCAIDSGGNQYCTSTPYTMNTWNQLVLVSDQVGADYLTDSVDVYLNGGLVGRLAVNQKGNVWVNSNDYLKIGEGFNGDLDEIKFWGANLELTGGDALCALGFGGIVDPTTGSCKLP